MADKVAGKPWVFANQLQGGAALRAVPPGSVSVLADANGRQLGQYHVNPHSLITARLLTRNTGRVIDGSFYRERLERALRLRQRLFPTPFYRLVHAEGDGLPGLVVDRHGDVLVVQPNTAGMDQATGLIVEALQGLLRPSTIVVQADGAARTLEGLEPVARVAHGTAPEALVLSENGFDYRVALLDGQKTGWFYDHRRNRAFVAELANGASVLDLYSYAGGFGLLAAARGATSVLSVDRSAPALALAGEAASAAGLTTWRSESADVFAWAEAARERFDIVVADPPAFAKSRKDVPAALKGYRKLAALCAPRVAGDGFLALASCSHHVEMTAFQEACADGIRVGGRGAKLIHVAHAGPDHPVHPQLPQTAYLKFLVFALSD
jgi:23S rRNA (cytosine1962-C5)-methyltransferase